MRVRLFFLLNLVSVINTACKKEPVTFNKFRITNTSGVLIKIFPTTTSKDTITLNNYESKEFEYTSNRGIGTGINYALFADGNPITVVFNNKDTIVHYNDVLSHDIPYYSQTSVRGFYNTTSYLKEIVDDSKYQRTVTLKYIFIPKDYLDAKNK